MKLNKNIALKFILLFATVSSSVFLTFYPQGFSFARISIFFFLLFSATLLVMFFIKGVYNKLSSKNTNVSIYFQFFIGLLIVWSIVIVGRSFKPNFDILLTLFGHYLMGWAWFTPLAIIFGTRLYNWISIFQFIGILLAIGCFIAFIAILNSNINFGFGALEWLKIYPVLFLTYFYQKKSLKLIAIISFFAFILTSIFVSERTSAVYAFLTLLFFLLEYFKLKGIKIYKKFFVVALLFFLMIGLIYKSQSFINDISNNDEVTTDTRTFLFIEFFEDMDKKDLLIGRGALGSYYSPYFSYTKKNDMDGDSPLRMSSEIGYLEMILKGGYILLGLNLLILIPASYLGIFKSKNIIGRMSGYIIVLYLVTWTISYYPVYSSEFIILWIAVGTAISKKARNIKDKDIIYRHKGNYIFKKIIRTKNAV